MQVQQTGGIGFSSQNQSINALNNTSRALAKILEKLSTAQRINRASDDAAGLGISEMLRTQVRGFKQASNNVSDAMSELNIAEGTATEISSMVQRQRELAVQSSNGTLTDAQRQGLNTEFTQLTSEIDRISGTAQFNKQGVANGNALASGTAQVQAGANSGDTITLPKIDMSANALGVSGLSIASSAGASQAIGRLDLVLNNLNTQRTTAGAVYNRLQSTQNNLSIAEVNTQAAESVIRDQDMAAGLTELTTRRLLQETGTRAFARFNQISANHMFGLLQ